ncbi:MAG TPA: YceI family protein [Chitinophagaceae bacterium]|nr:YceI family protein [Chitinophagaceae bacterium]
MAISLKTIRHLVLGSLLAFGSLSHAQGRYYTKSAKLFFQCTKSPLEKVEATNKSGTCVLDTQSGQVQFAVLMKGFEFAKALMQEHFNENYVESDRFPRSEFRGQVINNADIHYGKDGSYPAHVKGTLQIHGESRPVEANGTILIKGGKPSLAATFTILLSDYKIAIPSVVSDKISNSVDISVEGALEPLKN